MAEPQSGELFAGNLRQAAARLNVSRVELAHRLAVDKSVVRRWFLGSARPSEANLSALTEIVRKDVPDFTREHWFAPPDKVAVLLGLAPAQNPGGGISGLLPHFASRAAQGLEQGLDRYGGLWVQFYAPVAPPPARPLFCGGVLISKRHDGLWYSVSDGARGVWTGGGPAFAVDGKLWTLIEEHRGRSDLCAICFHGVPGHAAIIDGLALARAANVGGVPVTGRFTLVRIAELPEDDETAAALFAAVSARAGELSMSNLAAKLPDWLVDVLLGEASRWSDRHQAYVLALHESDNLTTGSIDIDLLPAGRGTRRQMIDAVKALFADVLTEA
jgi:transcriptional regulator with XRE-family HTH domain